MKKSCSIVVLNTISEWKGLRANFLNIDRKPMLTACLQAVLSAIRRASSNYNIECHVISSGNGDGCDELIMARFPSVRLTVTERGRFLFLYNEFIKDLRTDYVLLLNNDVIVEEGFILPLLSHFEEKDAFAVSPRIMKWKNNSPDGLEVGYRQANFWRGMICWRTLDCDRPRLSLYAHGAASAYHRERLIELGGFDELYLPYFYEDVDLSYRAWKRGWKCIAEPSAVVYHMCSQTIEKGLSADLNESIRKKNQLLFHWKNLADPWLLANHLLLVVARLVASPFLFDTVFPRALWLAVRQLPEVVEKRRQEKKRNHHYSDRKVLALLDGHGEERYQKSEGRSGRIAEAEVGANAKGAAHTLTAAEGETVDSQVVKEKKVTGRPDAS